MGANRTVFSSSHRLCLKCRLCFRLRLSQLPLQMQAILFLSVFVSNVEYVSDSDFPSYLLFYRPSTFSSSLFATWNMFQIRGKHFFFSSSLFEMWNMFQIRTFPAICLEAGHPPSRRLRLEARLPLQAVVAITADTVTIEIYYAW